MEQNKGNNLENGEIILESYRCAAQLKILVQGKIIVSSQALYFHSYLNDKLIFFGKNTKLKLPFSNIKQISKRKFAKIFDNAISVRLNNDYKLVLTSFVSRDACFELMYQAWAIFKGMNVNVFNTLN